MRKLILLIVIVALGYYILEGTGLDDTVSAICNPEDITATNAQNVDYYNDEGDFFYGRWGFNPWYDRFSDANDW